MTTKRLRAGLLVLAALVVTVALAACGSDNDSSSSTTSADAKSTVPATPEPGTFNMGIEPWLGYGPWRVAQSKGYFKDEGMGVKITNFTTDDQINAALASGKLDGSNIATHTALRLAAAGLPIKIVLLEDESTTADAILAGPGIASIKDLKGKKVAYEEGTTSDILLNYALTSNGMSISDIKKVPLAAADAGAAAIAGRVDAAVTYEPYLTTALKQNKGFKLLYTAGENPGLVGDVFVVRDDVLKNKPGQVAALLRAWDKAVGYYGSDAKDAQAIITKSVGAKAGELDTAFKGVKLYGLTDNVAQLHGDYVNKTIVDVMKAATDAKLIQGSVDPKGLIDTSFVDAVAKG